MQSALTISKSKQGLFKIAFALAVFTIIYNLVEGVVSTYFGFTDESLALFGFGIDSFIEVISGLGIASMIIRIRQNPDSGRADFERTALRITGVAFYLLVVGLVSTSLYNIWRGHHPETTFWGVVISIISIAVMWTIIVMKRKVGKELKSDAILADANCTKVCLYMSIVLLFSSLTFALTGHIFIDSLGTLGLAWFSFNEGRECFEKAAGDMICGCDHD